MCRPCRNIGRVSKAGKKKLARVENIHGIYSLPYMIGKIKASYLLKMKIGRKELKTIGRTYRRVRV
jgi:hypothetical protein